MSNETKQKFCSIGGSALMEGVMMRSPARTAIAVRKGNGDIILKVSENKPAGKIIPKIPILRGLVSFVKSMILSYSSMMYSAEIAMEEIEEETPPETPFEKFLTKLFGETGMAVLGTVAMILGVLLSIALFFALPSLAVGFVTGLFPGFAALTDATQRLIRSSGEGALKIIIFFIYLLLISRMKDIKRVFQYHGAEHKSIFCYERGDELTPVNAAAHKRFHPRCGTSFLFLTLLVGVAISLFIPASIGTLWRTVIRVGMIPIMMGLAYECIRLAGKYDNLFTRILSAPGLWFQHITTKEPDEKQLEVAIAALEGVLKDYPLDTQMVLKEDGYTLYKKEETDESMPEADL
ncbi:MAG: DUF1385 domain-containing protein [Clostridia bacterium]|nr:DUF1385 domain-containing protein [Clostridia bacterium]